MNVCPCSAGILLMFMASATALPDGERALRDRVPARETDVGLAQSVKVEASVDRFTFKAGEPIVIAVRLENQSDRVQYLSVFPSIYQKSTLQVYNMRGDLLPETGKGSRVGVPSRASAYRTRLSALVYGQRYAEIGRNLAICLP